MDSKPKNSKLFGKLLSGAIKSLATYENKTIVVIEDEFAHEIDRGGDSIQYYKRGNIPNEATIEYLVTQCVKRAYSNKDWLEAILIASEYPSRESLVNQLFPSEKIITAKPLEVTHNLPSPTYTKFVKREDEFNHVLKSLRQRSSIVLVVTFGGMGKTSLAREVAHSCIYNKPYLENIPSFQSAVWISDADFPGTTTLSKVLDEIAITLDYPRIPTLSFQQKKREVLSLLRSQKVLLIIDNFETITDEILANFLVNLPEPSKCIVTSREYMLGFRNNTSVIDLKGMSKEESKELIKLKLNSLDMSIHIKNLKAFDPLIKVTGGNPKAIEIALGYIKYDGNSLDTAIAKLSKIDGDLFKNLFSRCWSVLNADAKNVLKTLSIFPEGVDLLTISKVADIEKDIVNTSISKLRDLSLINWTESLVNVIYDLHPLTLAYASERLKEDDHFEGKIRKNWIEYYRSLAQSVGFCWNDIDKLKLLDRDGLIEGLENTIHWAKDNGYIEDAISISENIKYYYYVRGYWSTELNIERSEMAKSINNSQIEFDALVYQVNILSKQGNSEEAQRLLSIATNILTNEDISSASKIELQHSLALYNLSIKQYDTAIDIWIENLKSKELSEHQENANRRWLGICYFRNDDLNNSKEILEILYKKSKSTNFLRGVISSIIYLTLIDFKQKEFDSGFERVEEAIPIAEQIKDRTAICELEYLKGFYYLKEKNFLTAKESLIKAKEEFYRLGKPKRVTEIEEMLTEINSK